MKKKTENQSSQKLNILLQKFKEFNTSIGSKSQIICPRIQTKRQRDGKYR